MFKPRFLVLLGLILFAAASRLIPHPPNFSPIVAIALFGGAYFSDKRLAFVVPLTAMFLSDLVIGLHTLLPVIYGSFALAEKQFPVLGPYSLKKSNWEKAQ